jgi:hypothetical protein
MVMVFEGTPQEFGMDGYLKSNLDIAKDVIKQDWDMVFCVDGSERSGKSVFAMQAAYYCDTTLNLDRIAFTPYEFKKAVLSAKQYQAIIYDEAFTGLSSRATMSLINRTLVEMLAEIGQRNLFVFVIMPTFFDLEKYVALWRSRGLFHIRTGENFKRGIFDFYNVDRKKDLYVNGKKFYNYRCEKPNFFGVFPNKYVLDEQAYRLKKKRSLMNKVVESEDKEIQSRVLAELQKRIFEHFDEMSQKIKLVLLQCASTTLYRNYEMWKEEKSLRDIDALEESEDKLSETLPKAP